MFLDLAGLDWLAIGVDAGSNHVGALVHVGEEESGGNRGAIVEARAAVAVAAGADLEIEGAIDSVLLGTEDGGQVLRHGKGFLQGRVVN